MLDIKLENISNPKQLKKTLIEILNSIDNSGGSEITITDDGNGNVTIANVTSFKTAEGGAY